MASAYAQYAGIVFTPIRQVVEHILDFIEMRREPADSPGRKLAKLALIYSGTVTLLLAVISAAVPLSLTLSLSRRQFLVIAILILLSSGQVRQTRLLWFNRQQWSSIVFRWFRITLLAIAVGIMASGRAFITFGHGAELALLVLYVAIRISTYLEVSRRIRQFMIDVGRKPTLNEITEIRKGRLRPHSSAWAETVGRDSHSTLDAG